MVRETVKVLVAMLVLVAAPAPKDEDTKKDVERLQGKWRTVSVECDGEDITSDDAKKFILTFEKQTVSYKRGDEIAWKGTYKLDPSQKPKVIDITIEETLIENGKGKRILGIYEFEKEQLKWCSADLDEKDRPKAFSTKGKPTHLLYTLKKEN
jgi:uncharacterized protein (TIGR03067 family)